MTKAISVTELMDPNATYSLDDQIVDAINQHLRIRLQSGRYPLAKEILAGKVGCCGCAVSVREIGERISFNYLERHFAANQSHFKSMLESRFGEAGYKLCYLELGPKNDRDYYINIKVKS